MLYRFGKTVVRSPRLDLGVALRIQVTTKVATFLSETQNEALKNLSTMAIFSGFISSLRSLLGTISFVLFFDTLESLTVFVSRQRLHVGNRVAFVNDLSA